uniref:Ras-associating domain-containing protein n=1 Tax=Strigamia maritima TaxID=126957 RepID=T1JDJ9_STRMM
MKMEIPVWVGGLQKWVTGVDKTTTCIDVTKALVRANAKENKNDRDNIYRQYHIIEKWRQVQRPLDGHAKILKVWRKWGNQDEDFRLILKRTPTTPRNIKNSARRRKKSEQNDSLEQLIKVIVAQGETIQAQLRTLQDKSQQIDNYEQQTHLARVQQIGANYLLDSYLQPKTNEDDQDLEALYCRILLTYKQLQNAEQQMTQINEQIQKELSKTDIGFKLERAITVNCNLQVELARNDLRLRELQTQLIDKHEYLVKLAEDLQLVESSESQTHQVEDSVDSDTGLSSLHSDENNQLDTLV